MSNVRRIQLALGLVLAVLVAGSIGYAVLGFGASFLGMFVSATGTLLAPFVASAAPEACMQLDIRLLPFARTMYSSLRRISFSTVPSRESVWPSNSKAFMSVMLQERKT